MVKYRRSQVTGASYFFTVNLNNRSHRHLTTHIQHLRTAFELIKQQRPFKIDAIVILPDHLHMIMTPPLQDNDYPERWKAIKSCFTRSLIKEGIALIRNRKGEYNLWQRRYWEHLIRDETDMRRHIDYIHFNPVRHGHVRQVGDWPYSSFHHYVHKGILPPDWAGQDEPIGESNFGERLIKS